MLENKFQSKLIKEIKNKFKNSIVLKNDANYIQGFPDLLILYNDKWAALECKKSMSEKKQPNQEYYISKLNSMSFSKVIYPENKEEVLNELQRAFSSRESTCISERK